MSCELVMIISALACCIAEGRTAEELALMGSIFSQLGDTLATISAHQDFCSPDDSDQTSENR